MGQEGSNEMMEMEVSLTPPAFPMRRRPIENYMECDEVLGVLFQRFPVNLLKTSRLVSKQWNAVSLREWRKRAVLVVNEDYFSTDSDNPVCGVDINVWNEMTTTVEGDDTGEGETVGSNHGVRDDPFRSYKLYLMDLDSLKDELKLFVKTSGDWVKSMHLFDVTVHMKQLTIILRDCKNMEEFLLTDGCFVTNRKEVPRLSGDLKLKIFETHKCEISEIMGYLRKTVFKFAKNLKELVLSGSIEQKELADVFQQINDLRKEETKFFALTRLDLWNVIPGKVGDVHPSLAICLGEATFPLKELRINVTLFRTEEITGILTNYSGGLEKLSVKQYFTLDTTTNTRTDYSAYFSSVPIGLEFNSLKAFKVFGVIPENFAFLTSMPNLAKLKMKSLCREIELGSARPSLTDSDSNMDTDDDDDEERKAKKKVLGEDEEKEELVSKTLEVNPTMRSMSFPNLKEFDLKSCQDYKFSGESVSYLQMWMPNLTSITLPVNPDAVEPLFRIWPMIEEITLWSSYEVDGKVLTGIQVKKELTQPEGEFSVEKLSPPVGSLERLRKLAFVLGPGHKKKMTAAALMFVLSRWPNLEHLYCPTKQLYIPSAIEFSKVVKNAVVWMPAPNEDEPNRWEVYRHMYEHKFLQSSDLLECEHCRNDWTAARAKERENVEMMEQMQE